MKTGYILLFILLLVIVSGTAGYLMHRPKDIIINVPPVLISDSKIIQVADSLKIVTYRQVKQIDSLKIKLSKYGIKPKVHDSIAYITLPCDSDHIVQQLQDDIRTWQDISTVQDSINIQSGRFNVLLQSEIINRDITLQDVAILKRRNKNTIITFSSAIATFIITVLIFK